MLKRRLPGLVLLLGWLPVLAHAGALCETDDGSLGVSLTLANDATILDLAVTEGDDKIYRYAEANGSKVVFPARQLSFSAPARRGRPAIKLDMAGVRAGLQWRGKSLRLECTWD